MFYYDYKYDYALGLWFIFLVSVIWAGASILVQYVYREHSFNSPFLLTYIGTSLFTILLPMQWIGQYSCFRKNRKSRNSYEALPTRTRTSQDLSTSPPDQPLEPHIDISSEEGSDSEQRHSISGRQVEQSGHENENLRQTAPGSRTVTGTVHAPFVVPWTNHDHLVAAMKIAPIWFISNWAYNSSLLYTTITSSTVLSSTGSLFTFFFAACIYRTESYTHLKFAGVILGVVGSIMTGLHDAAIDEENEPSSVETDTADANSGRSLFQVLTSRVLTSSNSDDVVTLLWGDGLGLLSAIGYGIYAAMVGVLCPQDESLMSMQLFLGYVGLCNALVLSPLAIYQVLFSDPASSSAYSLTWVVFGLLVVKGLLDNVLSDYLWARAVILTSATVATVGLGLTIPLAFVSDVFWMGKANVMNPSSVAGALSVLCGFVLVNLGNTGSSPIIDDEPQVQHALAAHDEHRTGDSDVTNAMGAQAFPSYVSEKEHCLHPLELKRNSSNLFPPDQAYQQGFV
jgi:solute carrier family 35, member F5